MKHPATKSLLLKKIAIIGLLIPLSLAPAILAADALSRKPEKFDFGGGTAYFYAAPNPMPGRPWVWFFPTLKAIPLVNRKVCFEGFLNAGVGIAGYDIGEVRGAPGSTEQFTRVYDEKVRRGWSSKPILIGQSRGGLMALAWAIQNPEKPRAFVGIYPVLNLKTWGLKNMKVTLADYKMPEAELRERIAEFNPIDNLKPLIDKKLPVFIVQGDADKAVPHQENAVLMKERYEAGNAPITVRLFPGLGHQAAPEFFENKELIEFVLKQAELKTRQPGSP
ncbi:MAG: prolyl oligopeptidase family serine peptidase [Opitutaceae bacterium]|jgi:predicted esterase|nr:prolyl oligopeptidase family serine peptidase [Opitutaceae bacterium]